MFEISLLYIRENFIHYAFYINVSKSFQSLVKYTKMGSSQIYKFKREFVGALYLCVGS